MIILLENITTLPNYNTDLSCLALSLGVLTYDWSRRGGSLPHTAIESFIHKTFYSSRGGRATSVYNLALSDVQTSDEGWYCCTATNEAGSIINCLWLEVYS